MIQINRTIMFHRFLSHCRGYVSDWTHNLPVGSLMVLTTYTSHLLKQLPTAQSLTRSAGGPKFEPLYRDMYDEDEDWNEFLECKG